MTIEKKVFVLCDDSDQTLRPAKVLLSEDSKYGGVFELQSLVFLDEELPKETPVLHAGFFDSHLHVSWLGEFSQRVAGDNYKDAQTFVQKLNSRQKQNPSSHLIAYAFDEKRWGLSLESLYELCERALGKDTNWVLFRKCGHKALISKKVLETLPDSVGVKTILDDHDIELLKKTLPAPTLKSRRLNLLEAQKKLFEMGITAVGDMSIDETIYNCLIEMSEKGELLLDYQGVLIDGEGIEKLKPFSKSVETPWGKRHFEVVHWKRYLDGSFGAQSAFLTEPYSNDPSNFGICLWETNELIEASRKALNRGFALSFHAIGDAALEQIITLSAALSEELKNACAHFGGRVHRIEHVQMASDAQIKKLSENFPFWSLAVQPSHRPDDRVFSSEYLGEDRLAKKAYRLKSFIDKGIPVSLGSDAPIVSCAPEVTLDASINELTPDEKVSDQQALKIYAFDGRRTHMFPIRNVAAGERVFLYP